MSKRTLALLLGVLMLVTCLAVGQITTANAVTYYLWKAEGNSGNTASTYTCIGASPQSFSAESGKNYYIAVSTSSNNISTGTVALDGADFTGLSVSGQGTQGFDGKQAYRFSLSSAADLTVTYSSGTRIQVTGGSSGGGSGSGETTEVPTYYYRGADNSWKATQMTHSSDGYYAYIQSSNSSHQFKIATSETGWDYNWSYVDSGFNNTNVTNIGDYGKDNCYCWYSGTYYILVYYPNTDINTTANPKICASTTLPNDAPLYDNITATKSINGADSNSI